MRIIAYDRFKPGVTMESIEPYLPEKWQTSGGFGRPESFERTIRAPTNPVS